MFYFVIKHACFEEPTGAVQQVQCSVLGQQLGELLDYLVD